MKSEETVNPVQTTRFLGVKMGFAGMGNPHLQLESFRGEGRC